MIPVFIKLSVVVTYSKTSLNGQNSICSNVGLVAWSKMSHLLIPGPCWHLFLRPRGNFNAAPLTSNQAIIFVDAVTTQQVSDDHGAGPALAAIRQYGWAVVISGVI